MIGRLRAFGAFWYDFIIGDDWHVAVGVVGALALTFGLSRAGAPAWWVVPLAVAVLLPYSLYRATRKAHPTRPSPASGAAPRA